MSNQKRFIFSASAVAVAAKFDGANALNRSWATVSLPIIGGEDVSTEKGPNGNPVLSFGSATAHVMGFENPAGTFHTVNRVTVTNLNILNRVFADVIDVGLTFIFKLAGEAIDSVAVSPNPYINLRIDGTDYSSMAFEHDLADDAGTNHPHFRNTTLPVRRAGKHHIHPKGKAFTSLVKPGGGLGYTATEHAFLDVPNLGRIFFGEWAEDEDWQGVMGLRIVLNSPQAKGEIVIADWLGDNGQFYP